MLDIRLDRTSPVPLYFQLSEQLEIGHRRGRLAARQPDRERDRARGPAAAVAAHRAPGDPGAGRQGSAGAPARRRHAGRTAGSCTAAGAQQPLRRPGQVGADTGHHRARPAAGRPRRPRLRGLGARPGHAAAHGQATTVRRRRTIGAHVQLAAAALRRHHPRGAGADGPVHAAPRPGWPPDAGPPAVRRPRGERSTRRRCSAPPVGRRCSR